MKRSIPGQPSVTAIVVSYNTETFLRKCLASLEGLRQAEEALVVVVDNASTDGSVRMCRKEFPEIHLVENKSNRGFGLANNQGVTSTTGEYVLLLNSDATITPGCLGRLIEQMAAKPTLGVLGCQVLSPDGSEQPAAFHFPNLKTVLVERLLLHGLVPALPRAALVLRSRMSLVECDWVLGACMLVRRVAFQEVGGFDEHIWMYGEEIDLCYRIKAAGWDVACDPSVSIVHYGGASWGNRRCSVALLKASGLKYFFLKHHSSLTSAIVRVLIAAGALLRLLMWSAAWIIKRSARETVQSELWANASIIAKGVSGRL